MKTNNLFVLSALVLAFASCSKTEDGMAPGGDGTGQRTTTTGGTGGAIGPVPSTFTQKVVLETFTSANDPNGAENDLMIRNAISTWPGQVIATAFHVNDAMQGTPTFELVNTINGGNTPTLPGVMQNRMIYANKLINDDMTWDTYLASTVGMTPATGLAIETSVNANAITARVHVGFNSNQTGTWNLVVYAIRNTVNGSGPGYDQSNGSNNNPSSPLYLRGDPITNYTHNFVVDKVLTPIQGTTIPGVFQYTGGHFTSTFTFDVRSTTNLSDWTVVAFVYDTTDGFVMNTQWATVGTVQNWD